MADNRDPDATDFEESSDTIYGWITEEMARHGLTSHHTHDVVLAMDELLVWKEDGLADFSQALVVRACEHVAQQVGAERGTC